MTSPESGRRQCRCERPRVLLRETGRDLLTPFGGDGDSVKGFEAPDTGRGTRPQIVLVDTRPSETLVSPL